MKIIAVGTQIQGDNQQNETACASNPKNSYNERMAMRWSLIYHLMPTMLRASWLTLVEVNVFRHLVGLKVTLAVTDQSVLAEQASSPRFHCDTIVFHQAVKSHIDSVHYVTKKVAAQLFSEPAVSAELCTMNGAYTDITGFITCMFYLKILQRCLWTSTTLYTKIFNKLIEF